jgi:hypothetical protein
MGALDLVGGAVPRLAHGVEEVRDLLRYDPFVGEPPKRLLECLPLSLVGALAGGDLLGQQLRELAQLENGCGGVVAEVTLRQRGELDELRVVNAQERKVGAGQHPPGSALEISKVGIPSTTQTTSNGRASAMDRTMWFSRAVAQRQPNKLRKPGTLTRP